ncbi:MAG: hypothetical protein ACE5KM_16645 [Planctomycetaceae bacterium]
MTPIIDSFTDGMGWRWVVPRATRAALREALLMESHEDASRHGGAG